MNIKDIKMTDEMKKDLDTMAQELADNLNKNVSEKCSICGDAIHGFGNNADPVNAGRCCDICNETKVIPVRLKALSNK